MPEYCKTVRDWAGLIEDTEGDFDNFLSSTQEVIINVEMELDGKAYNEEMCVMIDDDEAAEFGLDVS